MALTPSPTEIEDTEIELLLEGLYRLYGYDFRDYAFSSIRRRIRERVRTEGVQSVTGLKEKVFHDPDSLDRLLTALSVNVSAMFRDPPFYVAFREKVVPVLRTYPFVRIWHAGCSTGEEVYSMAILLEQENLYDRCRIYATDMNGAVLQTAKDGIYPLGRMKQNSVNYMAVGSTIPFSEYYTAQFGNTVFRASLKRNVVFAQHNLATDGPFNEFHVIVCRNVMIYFNKRLQARVHELFRQSLVRRGFLCLGNKESLKYSSHEAEYDAFDADEKIYRRIR